VPASHILLLDNGSLAPEATRALRRLAAALSARAGVAVDPVSLLHSSAIPAGALDGQPAEIFEPGVAKLAEAGTTDFLVVPLFFGPSRALTDYLPERVAHIRRHHPRLRVTLAPTVFAPSDGRLAQILADHVRAIAPTTGRIALVDHGSPVREVTAVREALVTQLRELFGRAVSVAGASMERRPEPEYDFNAPLLADLLAQSGWNDGEVAVAMQFFLPGRHAGPDGDVARICRAAEVRHAGLRTRLTPLVGGHPLLVEILADRMRGPVEEL
jgi:sirohydrochlorin ferrochelatase